MTPPARHPDVPAEARWDGDNWELGATKRGKSIGKWRYWRPTGEVLEESDFGNGSRVTYTRYHADGSVSQTGQKDLVKNCFYGTIRCVRGPTDPMPSGIHDAVHVYEFHLDEHGFIVRRRAFDRFGLELVIATGDRVPPRPAGVPENADPGPRGWTVWHCDFDTQSWGEAKEWDADGVLQKEQRIEANGDRVVVKYWRDGTPWYESHARQWNDGNPLDQTEIYFNAEHERLYSVRRERVSDRHVRRYYDDKLVFEGRWDVESPEVRYYDLDGRVLLEYDAPTWRFHDGEPAEHVETNAADRTQYGYWENFMPGWASYAGREHKRAKVWTRTDPDVVRESFRAHCQREALRARLAALEPSAALAAECKKIKWTKLSTMANGQAELPRYLIGLLGDDEELAEWAKHRIAFQIIDETVDEDEVFDSTYAVALVLARVSPTLAPAAKKRATALLRRLLAVKRLATRDKKQYALIRAALKPAAKKKSAAKKPKKPAAKKKRRST